MEHKIRATFNAGNDTKNLVNKKTKTDKDSELLLYFTDVNKEKMDKITAENEAIHAKNNKIWDIAATVTIALIICILVITIICFVSFLIISSGPLMAVIGGFLTGILAIILIVMIVTCDDISDYFYTRFVKAEYCLQNYKEMIYVIKKCPDENTANYVIDNNNFSAPICYGIDHAIHINIKNSNIKIDNGLKDNVILIDGNMQADKKYTVSMYMNDHTKCLLDKLRRKK